jgi:hypothetical protein
MTASQLCVLYSMCAERAVQACGAGASAFVVLHLGDRLLCRADALTALGEHCPLVSGAAGIGADTVQGTGSKYTWFANHALL